ncbi:hypothetical protein IX49_03965 [Cellulophaga lytica]|uniref:PQQ-binding-like beta-propeller repeat protein n=1 Tax=Cellulophaga lytica TaxID=979 RepID=UPI0004F758B5|nr:PQQ-binding-like beta-propeller repeat protein [Cellulophaga lytica]AIM59715.1 hypothetical protein IX49_03965 [Cellulophaga lytica]
MNRLEKIRAFLISDNYIFYTDGQILYKTSPFENDAIELKGYNSSEIINYYNHIITYDLLLVDKQDLLLKDNIQKKYINNNVIITYLFEINKNEILIKKINENIQTISYIILNVFDGKEKELHNLSHPKLIIQGKICCSDSTYISLYDIQSSLQLWKLDVSKLGEYLHLKGTEHEELRAGTVHELYNYKTVLVALLRNDTIIGIDSATGDVLWQKPLFLFISRPVQLNDKLYHIITGVDVKNMLQVYDLATGKLEREVEITHQVLKENTFFTKRFINDTYIALTATKTGEILVINHKTAIIEDYAKLPNLKEKIPIDNIPQVHQNKVYQLDGEGTLYILEKEE